MFTPVMLGLPPVTACTSVIYRHFELKLTLLAYEPSSASRNRCLVFKVCLAALFATLPEARKCCAPPGEFCLAGRLPRRECRSE